MKKNYRVLHIIPSLAQGGAERQLLELVSENNSHNICQLLPEKNNLYITDKPIYSLNMKRKTPDLGVFYRLYKIINEIKPDIIHSWMYHSCLIETLLRIIIKNKNVPLVWGLRCSDMDIKYYSRQLRFIIKSCRFFSYRPDLIVHNSYQGKKIHDALGFNKKNIVISNGIDTEKYSPNKTYRNNFRNKYKISDRTKVLLCVSRFDPMKDHKTLLESFKKIKTVCPHVVLVLAGSGTEKFSNMDNIIALGAYNGINEVYAGSDIIVSSSAFGEGFSNALGEGMASGLIPIATNVGDSKFIIEKLGRLVEPRNPNKLAHAILEVLHLSENDFLSYKNKVRMRILESFSKNIMLSNYNKVYKDIMVRGKK